MALGVEYQLTSGNRYLSVESSIIHSAIVDTSVGVADIVRNSLR